MEAAAVPNGASDDLRSCASRRWVQRTSCDCWASVTEAHAARMRCLRCRSYAKCVRVTAEANGGAWKQQWCRASDDLCSCASMRQLEQRTSRNLQLLSKHGRS